MKKRLLTGDRPTGKLHLGHYVGSLKNRISLQDKYECFIIIADLHTLTTRAQKTADLEKNIFELVLDYLSVGIDPSKVNIYIQSQIPEVTEIANIFSNLITVNRLQRVPTLKEITKDLAIHNPSFGLLGYPVLMAADILMVKAEIVPVGKDQISHVEVCREVAQTFNRYYRKIFKLPQALVGEVPILPGTDGKAKMSKSLGNVINLSDSSPQVRKQVMSMYTDPKRIHGNEPGETKNNPVFIYLRAFAQPRHQKKLSEYTNLYQKGKIGDVKVKEFLFEVLEEFLTPIRKKRKTFQNNPQLLKKILNTGSQKARTEAQKTLLEMKKVMKMAYPKIFGKN